MKTKIFTNARWLLVVAFATFFSSSVLGTDVTFTVNEETGSDAMSKGGVSVTTTSGTFSRTDNYRVYASNSMTISVSSGSITNVAFTISQNTFTANVGTWNNTTKTWTGNASSITFSASGGQVRFTTFTVTLSGGTTYTVRWFDNSGQIGTDQEIDENSTSYTCPTSPTTASPNCGNRFVGWTKGTYNTNATPPTILFTDDSGTKPAITEDTDFYAVFADYAE